MKYKLKMKYFKAAGMQQRREAVAVDGLSQVIAASAVAPLEKYSVLLSAQLRSRTTAKGSTWITICGKVRSDKRSIEPSTDLVVGSVPIDI